MCLWPEVKEMSYTTRCIHVHVQKFLTFVVFLLPVTEICDSALQISPSDFNFQSEGDIIAAVKHFVEVCRRR